MHRDAPFVAEILDTEFQHPCSGCLHFHQEGQPRLGLEAGHEGLDIVHRILSEAGEHLNPGGVLIVEVGGWHMLWTRLEAMDASGSLTDPFAGNAGLALLGFFALWLGIPLGNMGQPHILVRFMAARDEAALRQGALISTGWMVILFTGAVLLGIAARAYYGELPDPEKALPTAAIVARPTVSGPKILAPPMKASGDVTLRRAHKPIRNETASTVNEDARIRYFTVSLMPARHPADHGGALIRAHGPLSEIRRSGFSPTPRYRLGESD